MKPTPATQPILVVADEDAFSLLLQHFPAARYPVLFAAGAAEAMALCETRAPSLVVLPRGAQGDGLLEALRAVDHAGAAFLGLATEAAAGTPAEADDGAAASLDRIAPAADPEAVLGAARELLRERRRQPRVLVEFPVHVGGVGQGVARDVSERALRLELDTAPEVGAAVEVALHWGEEPVTLRGRVERVDALDFGRRSVLLVVDPEDAEARAYLDDVIRKVLEVEHYLHALQPGVRSPRGPAAWRLARRAEAALRRSSELGVVRSSSDRLPAVGEVAGRAEQRPESAAAPSAPPPARAEEAPAGFATVAQELQARYRIGESRGQWGVGEVFEATHCLLGRRVLIKRLAASHRGDEAARERLRREARGASRVLSDCVADVLDFGEDAEDLYYTMEGLDGERLSDFLASRPSLFLLDVLRLGVHLSFALATAHHVGVLHLDLCPEHVFLQRDAGGLLLPKLLAFAGDGTGDDAPPPHPSGLAFRPPGEARLRPDAGWDSFALGRLLLRLRPEDGDSALGARVRALLERASGSDAGRRFARMEPLCRALASLLRAAESGPGADLGARIAPAVLPSDFSALRLSSTALESPEEGLPIGPWPRTAPLRTGAQSAAPKGDVTSTSRRKGPVGPTTARPKPDAVRPGGPGASDRGDAPGEEAPTQVVAESKTLYGVPAAPPVRGPSVPGETVLEEASPLPPPPAPGRAPEDFDEEAPTQVVAESKTLYGVPAAPVARPPAAAGPTAPARVGGGGASASGDGVVPLPQAPSDSGAGGVDEEAPTQVVAESKTLYGVPAAPPVPTGSAADAALPAGPEVSVQRDGAAPEDLGGRGAPRVAPKEATPRSVDAVIAEAIGAADSGPGAGAPLDESFAPMGAGAGDGAAAQASPLLLSSPAPPASPAEGRRRRGVLVAGVAVLLLVGLGALLGVPLGWYGRAEERGTAAGSTRARSGQPATLASRRRPMDRAAVRRPSEAARPGARTARRTPEARDAGSGPAAPDAGAARATAPPSRDAGSAGSRDAAAPETGPSRASPPRRESAAERRARKRREAKERLEKRLELINRARRLMRAGRYAESRKYLTEALKMWDSPRLRQLFSISYSRVGQVWPAIYHQRKAVALSRGSRSAQRRLGTLYLKVGKRAEACRAFRAARAGRLLRKHCGGG